MLRVAGVAKIITQEWGDKELAQECINACLLHDLGNIVKFDLSNPLVPIENLDKWRQVQSEVRQKYGSEAHQATYAMLEELGLKEYVTYLKEEEKIYQLPPTKVSFDAMSRPALLVLYSDLRVVPSGVTSLAGRVADLKKRYGDDRPETVWGQRLEEYIQTLTRVNVKNIGEEDVIPLFPLLEQTEI